MNPTSAVANELQQNSETIAKEMVNSILDLIGMEIPKQEIDQAIVVYTEYLKFLGDSIMNKDETTSLGLLEWSQQNGEREAAKGGRISDILLRGILLQELFSLRKWQELV